MTSSRSYPPNTPDSINVQGSLGSGVDPLSGTKLPLLGVKLRVKAGAGLGQQAQVVTLLRSTTLTPAAQLSNILVGLPSHFDFTGASDNGVSVQIGAVRAQGMLVSSTNSPVYDANPSQGMLLSTSPSLYNLFSS